MAIGETKSAKKSKKGVAPDIIEVRDMGGVVPPQAPEIENSVIGAILTNPGCFSEICTILKKETFYVPKNALVYETISYLGSTQQSIDLFTVSEELKKRDLFETVGGMSVLIEYTQNVISVANVYEHSKILAAKALERELIKYSTEIQRRAFNEDEDVDKLIQAAEAMLYDISQHNIEKDFTPISDVLPTVKANIDAAANNKEGVGGVPSGFTKLDGMTNGWQKSDLIIIAARPAMGKTAFVLSMARNIADKDIPVAVFSLEMSNDQLATRMLVNVTELPSEKIKKGQLNIDEMKHLNQGLDYLAQKPIYLDDTPSLSVFEFATKARRLVRDKGVKIIVIDYLQLMNASGMAYGSREQEVSTISRSLKQLAKELMVPIIALSQLNRSVESRDKQDKRPQLSDLRESGAIEQDADMVLFIHRPEYYKLEYMSDNTTPAAGLAEIIIAKHRNGSVGDVILRFMGAQTKFCNYDDGGIVSTDQYVEVQSNINPGYASGNDAVNVDTSVPVFMGSEPAPF